MKISLLRLAFIWTGALLHRDPDRAAARALDALLDEADAADAVVDAGEVEVVARERLAAELFAEGGDESRVDVGEALEIALGMARREARKRLAPRPERVAAARDRLRRPVEEGDPGRVGRL